MSRISIFFLCISVGTLVGCGGGGGPVTYPVSGTVTYNGKPVPTGSVSIIPNGAQDNKGPQAYASIKDGAFQTDPGKGHGGGAYIVKVIGLDGVPVQGGEGMDESGSPLFPEYQMSVDLPTSSHELNIEVPASQ